MEEKNGLRKLGWVKNLKRNEKKQNCITILSRLIGREIQLKEIDGFIDSEEFHCEFTDKNGNITEEENSLAFRFRLPWPDKNGQPIYGHFKREKVSSKFIGVFWGAEKPSDSVNWSKYGYVSPSCWSELKEMCGEDITEQNIGGYITSEIDYYNGAGYKEFTDGNAVTKDTGKFIKFNTSLSLDGDCIVGWFTRDIKGKFKGISWGTEKDFKSAQKLREQFYVGRMIFDSIEECNSFFDNLKVKIIDEPWEYKRKKDKQFHNPILKSYLEFELDRLFYEQYELNYKDRIIINKNKSKLLFNTNLINKFGHDLLIVGDLMTIAGKDYIGNLVIQPSKMTLRNMGFEPSIEPMTPMFFQDINEIIFHCEWEIDQDMSRYEHIIEQRIERFPDEYKTKSPDELGQKLDNAINFAKKIAQRNYKFIVPMYYPTKKRIQLLMPIYLEISYTARPDFALVLTPHSNEKLYTPETILGLDEVYQDARLIAKPEESWLNPLMIE